MVWDWIPEDEARRMSQVWAIQDEREEARATLAVQALAKESPLLKETVGGLNKEWPDLPAEAYNQLRDLLSHPEVAFLSKGNEGKLRVVSPHASGQPFSYKGFVYPPRHPEAPADPFRIWKRPSFRVAMELEIRNPSRKFQIRMSWRARGIFAGRIRKYEPIAGSWGAWHGFKTKGCPHCSKPKFFNTRLKTLPHAPHFCLRCP